MNEKSLLASIRKLSGELSVPSHLLLQNYLLERLLYRISLSDYKENIILKGGLLIASFIGVDRRTTMDMDTSIRLFPVGEESIFTMLNDILEVNVDDGIKFEYIDVKTIRQEDNYNGFRARIKAKLGHVNQNLSIDISTGDIITPEHIKYAYKSIINGEIIDIRSYNIESVLAEKIETIISRGVLNTRMRDFYDVYMLIEIKSNIINWNLLKKATTNTFENRDSSGLIEFWKDILVQLEDSEVMIEHWKRYLDKNKHIYNIPYGEVISKLNKLLSDLFK